MMDSELPLLPSSGRMADSMGLLDVGSESVQAAARPGPGKAMFNVLKDCSEVVLSRHDSGSKLE